MLMLSRTEIMGLTLELIFSKKRLLSAVHRSMVVRFVQSCSDTDSALSLDDV